MRRGGSERGGEETERQTDRQRGQQTGPIITPTGAMILQQLYVTLKSNTEYFVLKRRGAWRVRDRSFYALLASRGRDED